MSGKHELKLCLLHATLRDRSAMPSCICGVLFQSLPEPNHPALGRGSTAPYPTFGDVGSVGAMHRSILQAALDKSLPTPKPQPEATRSPKPKTAGPTPACTRVDFKH